MTDWGGGIVLSVEVTSSLDWGWNCCWMMIDWSGGSASGAGLVVAGSMAVVVATVSDYGMWMKLSMTSYSSILTVT